VLPPGAFGDDEARRRFRREALALSKLSHPNIGAIYDFDTQDGVDFLVMELVPGHALSERIAQGPMPESEIMALGAGSRSTTKAQDTWTWTPPWMHCVAIRAFRKSVARSGSRDSRTHGFRWRPRNASEPVGPRARTRATHRAKASIDVG
jgi:hypothetical protein